MRFGIQFDASHLPIAMNLGKSRALLSSRFCGRRSKHHSFITSPSVRHRHLMDDLLTPDCKQVIVDELRRLVVPWLERLRQEWTEHSLFGDGSPDLSPEFPFDNSVIKENFQFTLPSSPYHHAYRVTFRCAGRSSTSSMFCLATVLGAVRLGLFEIPPEIFDNPLRCDIDAHLVLDALLHSVVVHRTVTLVADVRNHPVQQGGATLDYPLMHFVLKTLPEEEFIRDINQTRCIHSPCYNNLPHYGPDLCTRHPRLFQTLVLSLRSEGHD
ncbi:hypothetical protein C8R44DRAFT_812434 [Mycena epipterygia]|nr:hypothetical protein C8R44DRAFT_812434 [Mycena epipterygia]